MNGDVDAAVPDAWAKRASVMLAAMARSAAMKPAGLSARDVTEVAHAAGLCSAALPGDEASELMWHGAGARGLVAMEDAVEAGVASHPTVLPPVAAADATTAQIGARLKGYLTKVGHLMLRPHGDAGAAAATAAKAAAATDAVAAAAAGRHVRFGDGAAGERGAGADSSSCRPAPRYEALRKRAESAAVWAECERPLVEMAESDVSRHARIMRFEHMRRGAIERYLRSFGARADPVLLAGAADLCTGGLLELVAELEAASRAAHSDTSADQRSRGTSVQVLQPDVSGTEREQRERSALTEAALHVAADNGTYVAHDAAGVQTLAV